MGITKALMEKVAISMSRNSKTKVCLTRYGNVMASRGSVIPLFINQIKKKESLTITDGNMTRFLMSLDEAVELVLYAFENGNSGDLFVHKAPCYYRRFSRCNKIPFKFSKKIKLLEQDMEKSFMKHYVLVRKCQRQLKKINFIEFPLIIET